MYKAQAEAGGATQGAPQPDAQPKESAASGGDDVQDVDCEEVK